MQIVQIVCKSAVSRSPQTVEGLFVLCVIRPINGGADSLKQIEARKCPLEARTISPLSYINVATRPPLKTTPKVTRGDDE
jgi:hypothetical protein